MAAANTHIIHQQRILIRAANSRDSLELQQAAGQVFWKRILPRLERLFDQHSSPQEVLRIERLEIDLGSCRPGELSEALENRFLEAVALELKRLAARPTGDPGLQRQSVPESQFGQWLYFLEHGSLPWSAIPGREGRVFEEAPLLETLAAVPLLKASLQRLLRERPAARRRLVLQYRDAFVGELAARLADVPATAFSVPVSAVAAQLPKLYAAHPALFAPAYAEVLQSSALPGQLFWEFVLRRIARGESAAWEAVFPILMNGFLRPALARRLPVLSSAPAPEQWLRQWEETAVATAARIASEQNEAPLATTRKPKTTAPPPADTDSGNAPETSPQEAVRTAAAATNSSKETDSAVKAEAVESEAVRIEATATKPPQEADPEPLPVSREELSQAGGAEISAEPVVSAAPPADADNFPAEEEPLSADLTEALAAIVRAAPLRPGTETSEEALHYISFAGLVLLHPFFSTLFQTLGYVDGKAFINFGAQVRAVHLLHFLAGGEEQPPEHQLLLPKLFCSLPLNAPIAQDVELTENERTEAIALLEAAIRHWGALGSASPDGLREGFLQREGKLEKMADGRRLTVERKTVDLLLDRLPWGIGMVKLPWMEEVLRVEWR